VLCLKTAGLTAEPAIASMVDLYACLRPDPELLVFRVRLGTLMLDLADGIPRLDTAQVASRLVREAVAAGDGYAAREVLLNDRSRLRLAATEEQVLSATVQSAGLSRGTMPEHLKSDLLSSVEISEACAADHLATVSQIQQPIPPCTPASST
jgi:hypothetical protein